MKQQFSICKTERGIIPSSRVSWTQKNHPKKPFKLSVPSQDLSLRICQAEIWGFSHLRLNNGIVPSATGCSSWARQEDWDWMVFKVYPSPNPSVILWHGQNRSKPQWEGISFLSRLSLSVLMCEIFLQRERGSVCRGCGKNQIKNQMGNTKDDIQGKGTLGQIIVTHLSYSWSHHSVWQERCKAAIFFFLFKPNQQLSNFCGETTKSCKGDVF